VCAGGNERSPKIEAIRAAVRKLGERWKKQKK
jgi:hypothetical protein